MAIPTEKAYELLNLPLGASKDCIEQNYKKLAFKWHPEKYTTTKNTQEALKKFRSINMAYRKLINNERDDKDISLHEMFDQYRQVFNKKKEKVSNAQTFVDIKNSSTDTNSHKNNTSNKSLLELNNNNNFVNKNKTSMQHQGGNGNNNNSTYFFGNEVNLNLIKNTKMKWLNDKNNNSDEENHENQFQALKRDDQMDQNALTIKLKAKSLAIKGNELAKQSEFQKAIEKFTEAIRFDYTDHRLYGNRSYCYDKINLFQEALSDAEKAIYLEPLWPKGYFRKGRALSGLRMFKEAEEAYEKVLEFENTDDPELEEELYKVRSLQLQEMGFSKSQSEAAIRSHLTVQAALEAIFVYTKSEKFNESCSDLEENDFDYTENDSEPEVENHHKKITNLVIKTDKTNFNSSSSSSSSSSSNHFQSNQEAYSPNESAQNAQAPSTSLWIGNVDPSVNEEILIEMFSQYGQLANVRCLPEKYCAFVNFKLKDDACKAMQHLQGKYLEGQRLLIKYPDNPNTVLLSSLVTKTTKNFETKKTTPVEPKLSKKRSVEMSNEAKNAAAALEALKLSGPVNGNECYFWRTTGCLYADKCRYEHLKKSKGIDKKPWHK